MSGKFTSSVAHIRTAYEDAKTNHQNVGGVIKLCNASLKLMRAALKNASSLGEKNHIMASIGLVTGWRTMLKSFKIMGSGYKPSDPNQANYRSIRVKWEDSQSAFSGRIRTGIIVNLKHKAPSAFLEDACELFQRRIKNVLRKHEALKVNAVLCGEFIVKKGDNVINELKYVNTKNVPIYRDTDLRKWFEMNMKQSILTQLEEFQEKDSGWALSAIVNLTVNINKFTPQVGSSYIELPRKIRIKNACINVMNNDEACFAWAVTSALYPVKKNSERVNSYPDYMKVLKLKGIQFPMTIKQILNFESQNSISINVYILEEKKVVPTYLTKDKKVIHVNLLLIEEDGRYHYVWIKNLSRLVSSQLSKHDGRKYFCDRCLHYFHSELLLVKHIEDCKNINECRVRLPSAGETMQFKNYKNKEKVPFVIYADLECILQPIEEKTKKSETNKIQQHIPYSIGYYVKCSYDDTLSYYRSYRGEDCQQWFAREMNQFAEDVETVFLCPLPMELSLKEEQDFHAATSCHICEKPLGDDRVRDHSHISGGFRGAAHADCNINFQDSHVIPIVFHNLSGYDSHFIIKNIAKDFEGRVDLLPINKEKYISFTKHVDQNLIKFRFIDSFRFMASSLEQLASYLNEFPNLKSQFDDISLLTRKGIFPYDFVDSWDKLNQSLPPKSDFYSALTDSHISNRDYTHAYNVYKTFGCQNLGEYSDLYLKTDVLLLSDVFEQFRTSCMNTYNLDPAHYYTLPGYTWDCMLKYTKIELDLLSDIDMLMFIERGIRGGLSQCSHRYTKANNKYLPDYDPAQPSKYLAYFDINNQYGWAMSQYLPYGGFEWVENVDWNVPVDNPDGYILEVDFEYPESIHDVHKDLPFCPEHLKPPKSRDTKLMATLYKKERYVIHYRNLIQALENGLILKKIHRVLKFKQSDWLKSYIDLNTKFRTAAKNDFEKDLFKLMNNAVFGKTMENIRNHSIVKLVTQWEGRYGAEALISKPQFKSSTIFDENLVAIELNKCEVYFNKPIYVGMCILDISKLKIYDFHYSYMRSRFGDKARVCYTDTDSLIYEVETDDLYKVIKQDANDYFDTSDYPENNLYGVPRVNKKVLGMMKDENSGRIMTEHVGLRSKAYATNTLVTEEEILKKRKVLEAEDYDDDEIQKIIINMGKTKKAKGVKKHIVKNRITFDDYVQCLMKGVELSVHQKLFHSRGHKVSTMEQTKIALSPLDDKRYISSDGISTLPWGHYSIMESS